MEKTSPDMKTILTGVMTDAKQSLIHGAGVGTATAARNFCVDVLHSMLPDETPRWVLQHPLSKKVEPIVASLLVMILSVTFDKWLPHADKAYWMAKTALEADGRDIIQPLLERVANTFREKLADVVIPNPQGNDVQSMVD